MWFIDSSGIYMYNTGQLVHKNETYQILRNQAVCKPHQHLLRPMNHHRLFPTACCSRLPLYPHTDFFLQQDEHHRW